MDPLTRSADKVLVEARHLAHILESDDPHIELALVVAKRVRRESTMLTRALARERDNATAQEGASNHE